MTLGLQVFDEKVGDGQFCLLFSVVTVMMDEKENGKCMEEVGEQEPCMGEPSTEPIRRETSVGARARAQWRRLRRYILVYTTQLIIEARSLIQTGDTDHMF